MCARQGLLHVMVQFDIGGIVEVADIQQLLDLEDAFFG